MAIRVPKKLDIESILNSTSKGMRYRGPAEKYSWTDSQRRFGNMAEKINLCLFGGSGLSKCTATSIKKDSEKRAKQKCCKFYVESTFSETCSFETFEEFCWCVEAQMESQKKG
jgi:hypothetical protein